MNYANQRDTFPRSPSTGLNGRTVLPRKTVPQDVERERLNAEFAAIIRPFPDKTVARHADVVEKTVQHWRAERSLPSILSGLRLARAPGNLGAAVSGLVRAYMGDEEFYEAHAEVNYDALVQSIARAYPPEQAAIVLREMLRGGK